MKDLVKSLKPESHSSVVNSADTKQTGPRVVIVVVVGFVAVVVIVALPVAVVEILADW